MIKHIALAAVAACLFAGCSKGDASADGAGKVVSTPAENAAIDTAAQSTEVTQAAAASSFTSDQAKGHLESAGYAVTGELTQTPDGIWHATATKDGKSGPVSVDFKGAISAN
ncbi:hypothetical protein [uncultured Phenylobacterium sp.]|uniref:hypothetical protein n=1 Tax=uncultured Phenylobacterium sp. TaxID=349273 RepID=UPI0025ECA8F4|nr:hypothetical protein [uncultured Phenylobacterium sp.]